MCLHILFHSYTENNSSPHEYWQEFSTMLLSDLTGLVVNTKQNYFTFESLVVQQTFKVFSAYNTNMRSETGMTKGQSCRLQEHPYYKYNLSLMFMSAD